MSAFTYALVAAGFGVIVWEWIRSPRTRPMLAGLIASQVTNLVLIDRGFALGRRLIPSLVALVLAGACVGVWQAWRAPRLDGDAPRRNP